MPRSTTRLLISGSTLRGIYFAAQVLVAFFLTPFVIHSLGDRMYGFWTLVAAFIGYYGLMDLGLGTAVSRYVAGALGKGDREESSNIFSAGLQLYVVLGLIVLALATLVAFLSPYFAHNQQDADLFRKVLLILGCSLALNFPGRAYSGLLNAELRLDVLALIDVLTLFLRTILVVCVLLAGYKVLALAWVTFFSGLPRLVAYIVVSRRFCPRIHFRSQPWFGHWVKSLLSYGGFVFIGDLSNQLRFNVDSFVITAFVGLAAVTHFRIAALMVGYFLTMVTSLVSTIQPWFSRKDGAGDYDAIRKMFMFAMKLSVCVTGFVGFGLIAWGKPFIQRWMGVSYLDAYPCLVVLALGCTALLTQFPSVSLMFGTSRHRFVALTNSAEGIANLALSLWLVRYMGIFGVALGTFIPMVVTKLFIQPLYACHISLIPYGRYMREFVRSTFVTVLALVVPSLISFQFVAPDYGRLTAVAFASFVCYIPAIVFFQFNKSEREMLRRAIFPGHRLPEYQGAIS